MRRGRIRFVTLLGPALEGSVGVPMQVIASTATTAKLHNQKAFLKCRNVFEFNITYYHLPSPFNGDNAFDINSLR
jgi:hypothetical protein